MYSNDGVCRSCGAKILWIRTSAGKNMPVNPQIVHYRLPKPDEKGTSKIVTLCGEVVSAIETDAENSEYGGYISHFATCPNAKMHRKK